MDKKTFIKYEIMVSIILIILFFKPLLVLYLLKEFDGYPGGYYNTLFISLLIPAILEILSIILPIFGFYKYRSSIFLIFMVIYILIVAANMSFSFFILSSAVP